MVDTYSFVLSNNKSKGIKFHSAENVTENVTINAISFAIPGQTSKDNISLNLGGFTKLISFNFKLKSRGTDVSCHITSGSLTNDSDDIVTLKEQWEWIMGSDTIDGIVQDSSGSGNTTGLSYTIRVYFDDEEGTQYKDYSGTLEDISIEPVNGESFLRGRLTLKQAGSNPLA